MKIIAVTNIKGGVGKTTAAVNLAYLCAASGQHTLLWDLDPQGAATYLLGIDPNEHELTSAKKLLTGKCDVPELIIATEYSNLDLLPANLSYRKFDIHLNARKNPTERLLKISRSLREVYEVLFLDCPPGISLLSENVLHAADVVIVPLLPTPLSVRMLVQLRDFIDDQGWGDLVLLPFFSMVDVRRSLHRELMASTRKQFPCYSQDRGAVLERNRTNEPAPGTIAGFLAERHSNADLCRTMARDGGANGEAVPAHRSVAAASKSRGGRHAEITDRSQSSKRTFSVGRRADDRMRQQRLAREGNMTGGRYRLYGRPNAGSLAPQMVLEEIGAPYELIWVRKTPAELEAFRRINSTGKIPSLVLPDGTAVAESAAILIPT